MVGLEGETRYAQGLNLHIDMTPQKDKDLIQRYWRFLVGAMVLASSLVMLIAQRSNFQLLVMVVATISAGWNVYAYAQGQRFNVAPGIGVEANDGQTRRRIVLSLSLLLYTCFAGLYLYSGGR